METPVFVTILVLHVVTAKIKTQSIVQNQAEHSAHSRVAYGLVIFITRCQSNLA